MVLVYFCNAQKAHQLYIFYLHTVHTDYCGLLSARKVCTPCKPFFHVQIYRYKNTLHCTGVAAHFICCSDAHHNVSPDELYLRLTSTSTGRLVCAYIAKRCTQYCYTCWNTCTRRWNTTDGDKEEEQKFNVEKRNQQAWITQRSCISGEDKWAKKTSKKRIEENGRRRRRRSESSSNSSSVDTVGHYWQHREEHWFVYEGLYCAQRSWNYRGDCIPSWEGGRRRQGEQKKTSSLS